MGHSFQEYWQWRKEHSKRTKGYPFINYFHVITKKGKENPSSQKLNQLQLKLRHFHFKIRWNHISPGSKIKKIFTYLVRKLNNILGKIQEILNGIFWTFFSDCDFPMYWNIGMVDTAVRENPILLMYFMNNPLCSLTFYFFTSSDLSDLSFLYW